MSGKYFYAMRRRLLVPVLIALAGPAVAQESQTGIVREGELGIIVTVPLEGPRATVFRALTQCDAIQQWLQPANMLLAECTTDARPGGTLKFVFHAPRDRKLEVRGLYRTVEENVIEYVESYDFSPVEILVTTTLQEADRRTLFKQTLMYRTTQERDTDFPNIASSAPGAYAKLNGYLRSLATADSTPSR
jgi:uncharacterized protein YndB with AHSA1/START domain